jgi:hypothetical protein
MEMDHRAVVLTHVNWQGCLGRGRGAREWRDLVKAARQAKEKAQPPPRVTPDGAEEFRKNVTANLNAEQVVSDLNILEQAAGWGGNLWEGRGETQETCKRVGWAGRVIAHTEWKEHTEEYGEIARDMNTASIGRGDWRGSWEGAWGETCTTVLTELEKTATRVEKELSVTLVQAATALRKHEIKPRTRRRPNGWFKGIGQLRRAIVIVNRMLAACRVRDGTRLRQLMLRGLRNKHLHAWISRVPGESGDLRWKLRTGLLHKRKKGLCMKMQGQARMTARRNMCEALELRERKFKAGNVRGLYTWEGRGANGSGRHRWCHPLGPWTGESGCEFVL